MASFSSAASCSLMVATNFLASQPTTRRISPGSSVMIAVTPIDANSSTREGSLRVQTATVNPAASATWQEAPDLRASSH